MGGGRDNCLFVATRGARRWIAWLVGDRLVELHVQRPEIIDDIGSIYAGRITRVDKNLDAAFVDIGAGRSGLLPLDQVADKVAEGGSILVQVARNERSDKGPRLSGHPTIAGSYLILTPGRRGVSVSERILDKSKRRQLAKTVASFAEAGEGFVIRTAASDASSRDIETEIARLRGQWTQVVTLLESTRGPARLMRGPGTLYRLIRDSGTSIAEINLDTRSAAGEVAEWCQTHAPMLTDRVNYRRPQEWRMTLKDILDQANAAVERSVPLPSGGGLLIEPGETLTAIDVDSGQHGTSSGDSKAEQVFLKTNLEAVLEIGRQLRLRNIGGIVVIDFINMSNPSHRGRIVERLKAEVAADTARCWVGSMSRLGLVEMTRRRNGPTLARMLTDVCSKCEASGPTTHDHKEAAAGDD